jgi:4-hydroxy-3-polyprenylbenzoate decarboxylase
MAYADLREYLAALEDRRELTRVRAEVNPRHELGAICNKLFAEQGPVAVLKTSGSDWPVVTNPLLP